MFHFYLSLPSTFNAIGLCKSTSVKGVVPVNESPLAAGSFVAAATEEESLMSTPDLFGWGGSGGAGDSSASMTEKAASGGVNSLSCW
jgi:hypothetical protein